MLLSCCSSKQIGTTMLGQKADGGELNNHHHGDHSCYRLFLTMIGYKVIVND